MHEYYVDGGMYLKVVRADSIQEVLEDYPYAMVWRKDGTWEE